MITSALVAYLKANLSNTRIFVGQAPLETVLPCITIDDGGDERSRHWSNGVTVTGSIEQDYECTVWATEFNALAAKQLADELVTLLDNFAGPMVDTSLSPNVSHAIQWIECENSGGDFNPATEHYAQSVFLSIDYK